MLDLGAMIARGGFKDLEGDTKGQVLDELIDLVGQAPEIKDKEALRKAVKEREEIMSTGIGLGIAIPHAKIPAVDDFVIGIGRARKGLEFDSFIDNQKVTCVVLIAAHANQASDYVRVLAKVTHVLKSEENRKSFLRVKNLEEVIALFTGKP